MLLVACQVHQPLGSGSYRLTVTIERSELEAVDADTTVLTVQLLASGEAVEIRMPGSNRVLRGTLTSEQFSGTLQDGGGQVFFSGMVSQATGVSGRVFGPTESAPLFEGVFNLVRN